MPIRNPLDWIVLNAAVNSTAHLERKDGKLVEARITSTLGRPLKLRYGTTTVEPRIRAGSTYRFRP